MNIGKFVLGSAIALGASIPIAPPSQAFNMPGVAFGCRIPPGHTSSHVLFAQQGSKIVNLAHFSGAGGHSRDMRCTFAANNLNAGKNNPNLQFITHGKMNNQSVVCMVKNYGNSCTAPGNHYLFTLARAGGSTQSAGADLQRLLFRLNTSSNSGAMLYDSESRLYVNINEYLEDAFESEDTTAVSDTTVVETSPLP